MRREWYAYAALGVALVVAAGVLGNWMAPAPVPAPKAEKPAQPEVEALPISHVVLFNSGVAYLQHEGNVTGDSSIEMHFPTTDINDLLKSLVLEDRNGHVDVVNYDSNDPVEKILRSFALDLTANPTFGQLLNQARGEKIEAVLAATQTEPERKVLGTIIGLENRTSVVDTLPQVVEMLNLMTHSGMKSIRLDSVLAVRFLNPVLQKEMHQALSVLAASHDSRKKRVTLRFRGKGERTVRVGYVVERPIWKMTYRLRLEDDGKLYLQGWALVENTSDKDWRNVRLSLVSGKPISFRMNLYQPLYIPRPLVELELFASLRPPVYAPKVPGGDGAGGGQQVIPPGQVGGLAGIGGIGGGFQYGGGFNFGGGFQIGGGFQGPAQPTVPFLGLKKNEPAAKKQDMAVDRLTYEELRRRREQLAKLKGDAKEVGRKLAGLNFKQGIESVATAEEIGDYFRYSIDQPVTVARRRSAMLPVFNATLAGNKVSIYNRSIHKRYPLLGIRFKNTTGHPLTQGPITVYDRLAYGGDTRILDVQPGEERLLSYAMDLGTRVYVNYQILPGPEMTIKLGASHLHVRYKKRKTTTYRVTNKSNDSKTLIIEHPVSPDWQLAAPKKRLESTKDLYRFEIKIEPDQTTEFQVVEEQKRDDPLALKVVGADQEWEYTAAPGMMVAAKASTVPATEMTFKIGTDKLTARYDVLRRTSFLFENRLDQPRRLILEYPIGNDWRLVSPKAEAKAGKEFLRFERRVDSKGTARFDMVEQQPRVSELGLTLLNQESRYAIAAGIEVKPVVKRSRKQLSRIAIKKGRLHLEYKTEETRVYYVQNNSPEDRTFRIDHVVQPEWMLRKDDGSEIRGPAIQRFVLAVPAKKTGLQRIVEVLVSRDDKEAVADTSIEVLTKYRDSSAAGAAVKAALQKIIAMHAAIKDTKLRISKAEKELRRLQDDQSRLRENLKIIPMNSDAYKQFLNKFVRQEQEIEAAQATVRRESATLETQTRDYERFLKNLTAE